MLGKGGKKKMFDVKKRRGELGISQVEFAKLLGVSRMTAYSLERKNKECTVSKNTIKKASKILRVVGVLLVICISVADGFVL